MTAVLSLAYFLRMLPRQNPVLRHLSPGLTYIVVMAVCGAWDFQPLPGLVLGGIGAALLPRQTDIHQRRGETGPAQVQLELASSAQTMHAKGQSDVDVFLLL